MTAVVPALEASATLAVRLTAPLLAALAELAAGSRACSRTGGSGTLAVVAVDVGPLGRSRGATREHQHSGSYGDLVGGSHVTDVPFFRPSSSPTVAIAGGDRRVTARPANQDQRAQAACHPRGGAGSSVGHTRSQGEPHAYQHPAHPHRARHPRLDRRRRLWDVGGPRRGLRRQLGDPVHDLRHRAAPRDPPLRSRPSGSWVATKIVRRCAPRGSSSWRSPS